MSALINVNLAGANLTNIDFFNVDVASVNVTGADLRGVSGYTGNNHQPLDWNSTIALAIQSDGTLHGVVLDANNPTLIVRNYTGSIPIHVQQGMVLTQSASLVLELDGAPWGSTISFDSGIPVTLGGNLALDVTSEFNPASLLGDSFQVFDWTGVSPTGQFASITNDLPVGYSWDTSQLYTTGNVTLVPEPGTLVLLAAACFVAFAAWKRRRN